MGGEEKAKLFIKVVYFDEQTASDYLDIASGGKKATTEEQRRERAVNAHAEVTTKIAAKLSWIPFVGGAADVGGGVDASSLGQSFLSKTLSNTILTDYLRESAEDELIDKMRDVTVAAAPGSMAYMKMFTPFMVIARTADAGVDLAMLDEALERAKGYYELIATPGDGSARRVLRFNIRAFRNNYGLADLAKMNLVFHGIRVGQVREDRLDMQAEMGAPAQSTDPSGVALLANVGSPSASAAPEVEMLDVYDVLLAGIEG